MEQKTDRLYPSATFGNKSFDLEQQSEEKLNDVNSLNNSRTTLNKGLLTSDKDIRSKKKYKNYKTTTI